MDIDDLNALARGVICSTQVIHERAQVERQVMGVGGREDAVSLLRKDPSCQVASLVQADRRLSGPGSAADERRAIIVCSHNGALIGMEKYAPQVQRRLKGTFELPSSSG